jgi:hypothetical protein
MPIRLNLLAEAQAAEDLRRRDPVKRSLWLAGLILALMLVWSSFIQARITLAHSEVTRIESQIGARTNEFRQVLDNQKKMTEIDGKLRQLRQLTANRFLNGTLLNALQKTTVDDVQLLRLRVDHTYTCFEGTKSRTNDENVVIRGKPPTTTEKILLTLEGTDASANPGDQVNRFKSVLVGNPYFKETLTKTNGVNLKSLSPPQLAPGTSKPCVMFALECRYPETIR